MLNKLNSTHILMVACVAAAATTSASAGESGEETFYRAYYVEHAENDVAAAADLYEQAANDRKIDHRLRDKARARLASCREELVSSDFARLMPPDALVYIECKQPGERILKFMKQLGLVADPDRAESAISHRIAVSPALIREVLGIRGIAVAITGVNPKEEMPTGVAVFDPGNVEIVRGLIETALPIGGDPVEPIEGHATYSIENKILLTLTSRLVIAGTDRHQIEGVVDRLSGRSSTSLASETSMTNVFENRDDSLLFLAVNAKPVIAMVKGRLQAEGVPPHELAIAQTIVDLDSIKLLAGRLAVGNEGLAFDAALMLDQDHKSLVFNLFRTPAISWETLQYVPDGAAAFLVGALNEPVSRHSTDRAGSSNHRPPVSFLDFGREVFANIIGFAIYALPPEKGASNDGRPIPDIAAAMSVVDPNKSEALWTQILGFVGMISGKGVMEGTVEKIAGVDVHLYAMPEIGHLYFTTVGNDVLIASTRSAVSRSIQAKRNKESVLDDDAFAASLKHLSKKSTKALVVHAGRCAQIVRRFAPPHDVQEIAPFIDLLSNTVVSWIVEHSDNALRVSARLTGIPEIGPMVSHMIAEQKSQQKENHRLRQAMNENRWGDAITAVDRKIEANPADLGSLKTKFRILAAANADEAAINECADALFQRMANDATSLNNFAWNLLTDDRYENRYDPIALRFSEASNESTEHKNWMFVDTLALAHFRTGDVASAVQWEQKAIELADGRSAEELAAALKRFDSALEAQESTAGGLTAQK